MIKCDNLHKLCAVPGFGFSIAASLLTVEPVMITQVPAFRNACRAGLKKPGQGSVARNWGRGGGGVLVQFSMLKCNLYKRSF